MLNPRDVETLQDQHYEWRIVFTRLHVNQSFFQLKSLQGRFYKGDDNYDNDDEDYDDDGDNGEGPPLILKTHA